ncbi:regulator of chromosome condensation 1/beta-lactamase-inhibitor protein II [Dunaliella salina]|uniref:Regulator of chromosome condensation 1/beta-lactamase-inhibitor protein II n=1 Tax=Dunaliella salina TaxID=3046 RepID=A0ABQ7GAD5_DUNSA|nr:regulator of chromosome condensation 1/beta-lactamase-inhibitor protein II [Dunaliella salina]|eukprot:KAF5831565.1 regulator of chromosome condensation 1/beta-lactamase-inhibitor protein II [Dunaliella salina]
MCAYCMQHTGLKYDVCLLHATYACKMLLQLQNCNNRPLLFRVFLMVAGRNQNGQLGLGHNSDVLSPQLVQAFSGQEVANVAGGAEHTIAAMASGEVFAWGWGRYGNLGDGCLEDRYVPTKVKGLDGLRITKVACGWRHSVVVSDQGQLYTFGWSKYGQLGHGDADLHTPAQSTPWEGCCTNRVFCHGAAKLLMQEQAQCGLHLHFPCYSRSAHFLSQYSSCHFPFVCQLWMLLDVADRNLPTVVPKLAGSRVTLLACGWRHTMVSSWAGVLVASRAALEKVVTSEGQVFTWGRGVNGQLGHGNEEDVHEPTLLAALSPPIVNKAGFQGNSQFDDAAVPVVPDMAPAGQGMAKKPRQQ